MNLLNTQVLLLGVTGGVVGAWDSSFFAWTPAVGFSLSLYFVVFCGCALLCWVPARGDVRVSCSSQRTLACVFAGGWPGAASSAGAAAVPESLPIHLLSALTVYTGYVYFRAITSRRAGVWVHVSGTTQLRAACLALVLCLGAYWALTAGAVAWTWDPVEVVALLGASAGLANQHGWGRAVLPVFWDSFAFASVRGFRYGLHTSAHHLAAAEQRYLVEQRGGSAHGLLHPGPTARGWLPLCFLALVRPWAAPSSVAGTLPVKRAGAVLAAPLLVLSTLSQAAPLRPGAHPLHAWVWASVFLARPRRHFSLPPLQRAWHLSFGSALLGALVPKTWPAALHPALAPLALLASLLAPHTLSWQKQHAQQRRRRGRAQAPFYQLLISPKRVHV